MPCHQQCVICATEFEAQRSTAKYCPRCKAVKQAVAMRNETSACRGCDERFYRRDSYDPFCPACHQLGFGDKRWHLGPPLEAPCTVCDEHGPSVAPGIQFCAHCLASPDRDTAVAINRKLRAHVEPDKKVAPPAAPDPVDIIREVAALPSQKELERRLSETIDPREEADLEAILRQSIKLEERQERQKEIEFYERRIALGELHPAQVESDRALLAKLRTADEEPVSP